MDIYSIVNYPNNIYSFGTKPVTSPAFTARRLLTEPIVDTCCFTHVDKSLSPKLLKSLAAAGKGNINLTMKVAKMKDVLLRAMGYKHPEELKIVFRSKGSPMSYSPELGQIVITNGQYSVEYFIAALRHELEHMDQFVKIYKTKGKDVFLKSLIHLFQKNNPNKTKPDIEKVRNSFNSKFYEIMAKDVSVEDFDAEKYYRAMLGYKGSSDGLSNAYRYHNNLLEKDAYDVTRKVLKALGKDPVVSSDVMPVNYKTLIKLLNDNGIAQQYHDGQLGMLHSIAEVKIIETPENYKRFVKIWDDFADGTELSAEDKAWFDGMFVRINAPYSNESITSKAIRICQDCYKQVELWLRKGLYCPKAILNNL